MHSDLLLLLLACFATYTYGFSALHRKNCNCITRDRFQPLKMVWSATGSPNKHLIAPSILSSDFARLGEEVDNVLAAGADVVHFDIIDNHYAPNLTIGPMVCKALRDYGIKQDIDVHLMVDPVDEMIVSIAKAGASYITFHSETSKHVDRSLQLIRSLGCRSGLVLTPSTSLDVCKYVMDKLDIILIMSANPGFSGEKFIYPGTLKKLAEARKLIEESGYDIRLEVDGGVTVELMGEIAEAGANMFVSGSALMKPPRTQEGYAETIKKMREQFVGK